MKYLFSLLLLVSLGAYAQEPPYTPMRLNYQFRGIRVDSLFLIPNYADTSAANGSLSKRIAGSFIRTGNDFWMRNSDTSAWLQNVNVGSGASPTLNFVNNVFKKSGTDSVFYVVAPADTFFSFKDLGVDTTSLSNRINLKVDSLKRSSDSVYFKRSGVWSFGYKDSLGQSINFANADLTATGNRLHNFNNKSLTIDSVNNFRVTNYWGGGAKKSSFELFFGYPYVRSTDLLDNSRGYLFIGPDDATYGAANGANLTVGLYADGQNSKTALQYGNNFAWLPQRNFGNDTIALKSDITGGQNFANANLTATGSRTHNFKNYDLLIDSIGYYDVQTYSPSPGAHRSYTTMSESGVGLYMTNTIGQQSGFFAASPFNQVYIRRDDNNAWISKKNFGQDTLAFVSQIKVDSPDRINGTATGPVTSDMQGNNMRFTDAFQWKIDNTLQIQLEADSILDLKSESMVHSTKGNKYEFKDFNNTFLRIDTLGNFEAGDLTKDSLVFKLSVSDSNFYILSKAPSTWREKNSGLKSQIKTGYSKNDIDLSSAAYVIKLPGVYSVLEASVNTLTLPNPTIWPGQSITIINQDGTDVITYAGGYDPLIYDNTTIGTQWPLSILTMYSDGVNWFAIYNK